MCKTAIIMSEAEAMALPQSKRPLCFRVPPAIYTAVWEHIGLASNESDTEVLSNCAVDLLFKIASELERLGVTTEMMRDTAPQPLPDKSKLETAEAEIARLENITTIQAKQIERLMEQRDKVLLNPEHRTVATELPSGAIVQAECRHEYQEGSTVCRLCGS